MWENMQTMALLQYFIVAESKCTWQSRHGKVIIDCFPFFFHSGRVWKKRVLSASLNEWNIKVARCHIHVIHVEGWPHWRRFLSYTESHIHTPWTWAPNSSPRSALRAFFVMHNTNSVQCRQPFTHTTCILKLCHAGRQTNQCFAKTQQTLPTIMMISRFAFQLYLPGTAMFVLCLLFSMLCMLSLSKIAWAAPLDFVLAQWSTWID